VEDDELEPFEGPYGGLRRSGRTRTRGLTTFHRKPLISLGRSWHRRPKSGWRSRISAQGTTWTSSPATVRPVVGPRRVSGQEVTERFRGSLMMGDRSEHVIKLETTRDRSNDKK
jgi:hypothetical protein